MVEAGIVTENAERLSPIRSQWWGGMFEAAGSMWFTLDKKNNEPYNARPGISYNDNSFATLTRLKRLFGGSIGHSRGGSSQWRITGERASKIAELMESFAPSRREMINLFVSWGAAQSNRERLGVYERYKSLNPHERSDVPEGRYDELVKIDDFIGGITDARIRKVYFLDSRQNSHLKYPGLKFNLSHQQLVEVLQKRFGGSISVEMQEGQEYILNDTKYLARNDSIAWILGKENSRNFLNYVLPFSVIRQYELRLWMTEFN
ncbi:MAG TPA: hypothetical protein VMR41_04840 [Patescibacteria group bacterium]|nr:hypothetical protein [Patescibacteria group bacterium]